MKEGWEIKKLGEVCEIRSGRDYKKVIDPNGIYPILGSAGKTMGLTNEYICEEETTIIGRKGTINSPIFIKTKFWNVDTAFGLHALEKLDKRYLFNFCLHFDFTELDKGSGRPSLVKKDLLKISIPFPTIQEQKRIVALLDRAFEAIDKAKNIAKQNLKNAKELFESYLNRIFEEKGEDWVEKKLGEVCEVKNGGTPKTGIKEYWDGDVNWITPKDLGKLTNRYVFETPRKITSLGLQKSSAKLLPINSIILSTRAPIGHLAINKIEMATNQGCRGIIPSDNILTEFVYYFLSKSVEKLNELGTGATFKELSSRALYNFVIPFPKSIQEQKRIVAQLDKLQAETKKLEAIYQQKLDNLEEMKKSVLQKAFSGELTEKEIAI